MSDEKRNIDKMLMEMFPSDPEIAECFIGILNVISGPVSPQGESLIQGHTAEQWQEIKEGGYLCEFADQAGEWYGGKNSIKSVGEDEVESLGGAEYRYCRPAQLKGVMRPIFVEPVDEKVFCVFFDKDGCIDDGISIPWNLKMPENEQRNTKYIEL